MGAFGHIKKVLRLAIYNQASGIQAVFQVTEIAYGSAL